MSYRNREFRYVIVASLVALNWLTNQPVAQSNDAQYPGVSISGLLSEHVTKVTVGEHGKTPQGKQAVGVPSARPSKGLTSNYEALAQIAENRGHIQQAKHMYQAILHKQPNSLISHQRLGSIAMYEADYANANSHFAVALRLVPANLQLLQNIGRCCYAQERYNDAELFLQRAADIEPDNRITTSLLGLVLAAKGQYQDSCTIFENSIGDARAYSNFGFIDVHHKPSGSPELRRPKFTTKPPISRPSEKRTPNTTTSAAQQPKKTVSSNNIDTHPKIVSPQAMATLPSNHSNNLSASYRQPGKNRNNPLRKPEPTAIKNAGSGSHSVIFTFSDRPEKFSE